MDGMSNIELIALAVLTKDMAAARALLDILTEEEANGIRLPPVKHIKVDVDRIRVAVFFNLPDIVETGAVIDEEGIGESVRNWLTHGGPLILSGVERIELYEMPPSPKVDGVMSEDEVKMEESK